jgi:hypothetical protein
MKMATYKQAANYLFESLKEDVDLLYVFPEITWIEGNSADLKLWFKMLLLLAKLSYQRFVKKEKLIMPQYPLESLYNSILTLQGNFDCLEKSGVLRYKISRLYIQSHKKYIPILCVETGIVYNCPSDAAVKIGKKPSAAGHIVEVCKGKRKTAYGYCWQYLEKDKIKGEKNDE